MFNTLDELLRFCADEGVTMADFKMTDIHGRWRHVTLPIGRLNENTMKYGIGFDGSNYGYAPVENSDMVFIPDLTTAVIDPYSRHRVITMTGDVKIIDLPNNRPFDQYPRNVIRSAVEYMREQGIADEMLVGPEFEFHIFENVQYHTVPNRSMLDIRCDEAYWESESVGGGTQLAHKGGYHADVPFDTHFDLRSEMCSVLEDWGVKVKYHHHEVGGPSQQEIEPEMGEVVDMADKSMVIKHVIRNTAEKAGKSATFLPKPLLGEAGNGMHVHIILKKDGKTLFYDPSNYAQLSDTALYFIGGLLKHAASLCAITNPTTNSFKRLVPGFEAPVTIGFATANRSAVIRIPAYAKSPEHKRFEIRNPDAMCNPYYAYSALLMAGIDGIMNKIDPRGRNWGPFDCNLFDLPENERTALGALPANLKEALDALESDHDYLTRGNVFPQRLLDTWLKIKRRELSELERIPTPAEFERYYSL